MRLSRPIPNEIWENVMGYLATDKTTLKAIIQAECVASHEAIRAYWQNGSLEELKEQPESQQQSLANFLRGIVIEFKVPDADQEGRGLRFPQLQTLTVQHNQALCGPNPPHTYAGISNLISHRLESLEIGFVGCQDFNLQPTTDNFLTKLSTCVNLRYLTLCARVNNANPQDLAVVLRQCTRLDRLVIEKQAEELIDEKVMEAIAKLELITHLEMDGMEKRLDRRLMSLVEGISKPGRNLNYLYLSIDTAAISMFLPRLDLLKVLHLDVYGAGSIFRHLRHLKHLWSIWLKFASYTLTDNDLSHLAPLRNLQRLELSGTEWGNGLDARLISADVFATVLDSMPALESIDLHAANNLGDPLLLALGRSCRNIKTLEISGQFAFEALIFEPPTLFPCLETLGLGGITPTVRLGHELHRRWASRRAGDLALHAPKLMWFRGDKDSGRSIGVMVEEAWKVLKSERNVKAGGG